MRRADLSLIIGVFVLVMGMATASVESSNKHRGGELYGLETRRLRLEEEIPHLRNTLETLEMGKVAIESAFAEEQTADG